MSVDEVVGIDQGLAGSGSGMAEVLSSAGTTRHGRNVLWSRRPATGCFGLLSSELSTYRIARTVC